MRFGETLRELLAEEGITQKQMAADLNIAASTLGNYIQNSREPDHETLKRIADYFDVSMDYLYCRTDEPRGKLYDYQPERLKGKNIQNQELRDFIEMCFDPQAPVNKRLKEALFRIMEEGQEKT